MGSQDRTSCISNSSCVWVDEGNSTGTWDSVCDGLSKAECQITWDCTYGSIVDSPCVKPFWAILASLAGSVLIAVVLTAVICGLCIIVIIALLIASCVGCITCCGSSRSRRNAAPVMVAGTVPTFGAHVATVPTPGAVYATGKTLPPTVYPPPAAV